MRLAFTAPAGESRGAGLGLGDYPGMSCTVGPVIGLTGGSGPNSSIFLIDSQYHYHLVPLRANEYTFTADGEFEAL